MKEPGVDELDGKARHKSDGPDRCNRHRFTIWSGRSAIQNKWIRDAAVRLFGSFRVGKETAAIKIDAWGKQGGEVVRIECFLLGRNESVITGKVAAFVGDMLYRSSSGHGVYYIEQQYDLESLFTWLDHAISIETRINGKII